MAVSRNLVQPLQNAVGGVFSSCPENGGAYPLHRLTVDVKLICPWGGDRSEIEWKYLDGKTYGLHPGHSPAPHLHNPLPLTESTPSMVI